MAEIHVETKKHQSTPAWIWILVTLAIIGILAYFLTRNNTTANEQNNPGTTGSPSSYIQPAGAGSFYLHAA